MNLIVTVIAVFVVAFALGLSGPMTAQAATTATTPSLGAAATFGVLSSTYTNPIGPATINGDLGYTTPPVVPAILGVGSSIHTPLSDSPAGSVYLAAGTAQANALIALNGGVNAACDWSFPPGDIDLSIDISRPGPAVPGVYPPGVYCITGAMSVGTVITLDGAGTYIFRSTGALNTVANSIVTLAGTPAASACDVFWAPNGATTINADSTFIGTVIPVAQDITVYGGVATSWIGRALSFLHTVKTPTPNVTITVPVCAALPPVGSTSYTGTINVVKTVVGGTKTVADFPLFINGNPVVSGATSTLPAQSNKYTVTETMDLNYTQTFSGDCDSTGVMYLHPAEVQFCVVTNTFKTVPVVVPPLIDVVKVPSPLSLPAGPGAVTYTYTLRNVGTVPVTNITMVDDTCSPLTLVSGDTNSDAKLQVSETWTYSCSTTLSATHTNNVVATGWANGISVTDIASAIVVVGSPVVPPLIHVTKIPSPLTLLAKGGMVTYTEKITNPGTVALSNVKLNDDKCSPMKYISGDTNGDSKLDTTETWTYTCRTNLTKTTTNTAIASGEANGYTVRDLATATVVVAAVVPKLPNTGFAPAGISIPWNIIILAGIFAILIYFYFARKKQTT